MSNYLSDDPSPSTPIFDETVNTTAVRATGTPARSEGGARAEQAAGTVQDAAGQAKDTAKEAAGQMKGQAQEVGATAADAGQRVASTAKDQASNVASDAVGQAKDLYGQATAQLSEQAGKQQKNAASALHGLSSDLNRMGEQHDGGGLAAELVQNVSQRAGRIADWLEHRDPSDVLDEVKQYAARRPGAFIALAAVAGIVGARAAKALTADAKQDRADAVGTRPATTRTTGVDAYGSDSRTIGTTTGGYGSGYGTTTGLGATDAPRFGVVDGDVR